MNITLPDLSNYSTFVFLYAAMICLFLFIMLNKFNFKKDKDGIALSVDDDQEKNGDKNAKGN
jgi:hypothetical protein